MYGLRGTVERRDEKLLFSVEHNGSMRYWSKTDEEVNELGMTLEWIVQSEPPSRYALTPLACERVLNCEPI